MIFTGDFHPEHIDILRDFLQNTELSSEDEEKVQKEVLEKLDAFLEGENNDS